MNDFRMRDLYPLFSAAEDVQHSADRLESAYRGWMNGSKHRRKELITAFETTKWQLEEFERAFAKANVQDHGTERALERYRPFIEAISQQISLVEKDLRKSGNGEDTNGLYTVSIGDGERDELAIFLLGNQMTGKNDTNGYTFSRGEYHIDERLTSYSDEAKRRDTVTCNDPVALTMDAQEGTQALRAEVLCDITVCGSKLQENVNVYDQEPENSLTQDSVHRSADQSLTDNSARKTDIGLRNGSIENGFADLKNGIDFFHDKVKDRTKRNNIYQVGSSWFSSVWQQFGGKLLHSKSGLKRYKDGELDSMTNFQKDVFIGCVPNVSATNLEKGESSKVSTSGRWWNGFPFMSRNTKQTAIFRNRSEAKMLQSYRFRFFHYPSKIFLVLLVIILFIVYFWILSRSMLHISGDVQGN